MDVHLIALIIGCVGLLSRIEAQLPQFPFQTGPILVDPYAPFFGSNELNPFASNEMQIAIPRHHYHKRPTHTHSHSHHLSPKLSEHRDYHKKLYESEPSKWRKYSRTSYTRGLPKRNYKKMLLPVHKYNGYDKALIRARPQSDVDSFRKHKSYERNNLNQNPIKLNYKNSNTFRESVPIKPLFKENHSSNGRSEKRTDRDSDDNPSNLDFELSADEENEEPIHNDNQNRKSGRSSQFKPHNYHIKERAYIFNEPKYKRPALYEIEAPKNLDKNRPAFSGPAFVQKISVPHKTLMEIADISGPPRPSTSRRPHPFEGFHQHPRHKPDSEIIVNSLGDGMTRQVGASMSVQLEDRNFQPKGKIFDEPISNSDRKPLNQSPQQMPFRSNEGNPFNSKHFDTFSNMGFQNNREFRALNSIKKDEKPFPINEKSDNDYDDDESSDDNQESNDEYKKPVNEPTRPRAQPYVDNSPDRRPPLQETETEKPGEGEDEEWTSNGIPGQPGKDYPMLSAVPLNSQFSCVGRPHGFYADISQKCQVYHQCSAQGSQKFLCPNGTLFNQESLVCEWWYNVLCENSEQLYHKNEQLYRTDNSRQQNDDKPNDENRNNRNHNEYNRSWNPQNHINNSPNDNHNHNNDNNYHNHNNNHNNNPHNHYSNGNFRANSGRNDVRPNGQDLEYEDIDVDLTNVDESRNSFIKVVSNHQLVSKLKPKDKTKNIALLI